MITIENEQLRVQVDPHGAQMHSIRLKNSTKEYLWQGNPTAWDRQAPILFPFVGKLKDDQFKFKGKTYHQTQHGFARDSDFQVVDQSQSAVSFQLEDSPKTLTVYPFKFNLRVSYQLIGHRIQVSFDVLNPASDKKLFYAIGAHPGFHIPLSDDQFEDYRLEAQPAQKYPLNLLTHSYNELGVAKNKPLDLQEPLIMTHQLFKNDVLTLVTKGRPISLKLWNPQNKHGIELAADNAQFIGLWSSYPSIGDFVCIEPWWGIADNVKSDGQLIHKQAIHQLQAGDHASYHFSINVF